MNLLDRITEAVEIVAAGSPAEGSLREQAESHLGTEIDGECALGMMDMANAVSQKVFDDCMGKGVDPITAVVEARTAILIAGMAVGKRLGAEEGEEFGRITAQLDKRHVV